MLNYSLCVAHNEWHGICKVLRLEAAKRTVVATFWNQHLQIARDLQLFKGNMCKPEGARSILGLGISLSFFLLSFLPSLPVPPSFFTSLLSTSISFLPVWFYATAILWYISVNLGATALCRKYVNSSSEVSWLLHGIRE